MKNQIIEKARKLKALASSPNPNEANLALKKMQEILIKYGLKESDLAQDEFGRLTFLYASDPWARQCINHISKLYFCRMAYVRESSSKTRYIIIGIDQNAEVVKEMCLSVLDSIRRESRKRNCDKTSFRKGSADQISMNCLELIAAAKNGDLMDDCGEALVIGDMYQKTLGAIDKYISETMTAKEVKPRKSAPVDKSSYMMGLLYGDTVELQKKMNKQN